MYEKLEDQAKTLNALSAIMKSGGCKMQIDMICDALDAAAIEVGQRERGSDAEAKELATLFRCFHAAKVVLMQLHESFELQSVESVQSGV
jgi:hypothetical protein